MPTNPAPYPRWERHGHVSRFYLGPGLPLYEVEERALLGGALFVASAVDTAELIGQFESEHNAQQALHARLRPPRQGRPSAPRSQGRLTRLRRTTDLQVMRPSGAESAPKG
jgi:hypothetical protein